MRRGGGKLSSLSWKLVLFAGIFQILTLVFDQLVIQYEKKKKVHSGHGSSVRGVDLGDELFFFDKCILRTFEYFKSMRDTAYGWRKKKREPSNFFVFQKLRAQIFREIVSVSNSSISGSFVSGARLRRGCPTSSDL